MNQTTNQIPKAFDNWLQATYGEDADKIDVEAQYDTTLTDSENRTDFLSRFPPLNRTWKHEIRKPTPEEIEQLERTHADNAEPNHNDAPFANLLQNIGSIAIVGERGTGKTALAHRVADTLKAKGFQICAFKHPHPEDLHEIGYKVLFNFGDIEELQDCVLWISEPQLHIPSYDKKANDGLLRLLSICRQRNVTLLIDTCDSRFITRGIESYIDAWMIKDCDPQLLKQGSKIKKIIQENCLITVDGFTLPKNQFLYSARKHPENGGRHKFVLPSYWKEAYSTPYRIGK